LPFRHFDSTAYLDVAELARFVERCQEAGATTIQLAWGLSHEGDPLYALRHRGTVGEQR